MRIQSLISNLLAFFLATVISLWPIGRAIGAGMQEIDGFSIDRTEVSVGEFRKFVKDTGSITKAEKTGGGLVYGAGWERKTGWTWSSPFCTPAEDSEPAVHITFDEAAIYCRWAGKSIADWQAKDCRKTQSG